MAYNEENLPEVISESQSEDRQIEGMLELDHVDRLILKYIIAYPDIKSPKLGKIIGVSENTIRHRRNKPSFQMALLKLSGTTDSLMTEAAKKAAFRLIELIDHPNPMVALGAIKIALAKYINQISDATMDKILVYKTTIAPDGNLLQDIVKGELGYDKTIDVE